MTSDDIDQAVGAAITTSMIIERMIEMMSSQSFGAPTVESESYARLSHRKRASYSTCMCSYCAAIKTYVSLKRRVKRLEEDMWSNPSGVTDRALYRAQSDLSVAIRVKDAAKAAELARGPVLESA